MRDGTLVVHDVRRALDLLDDKSVIDGQSAVYAVEKASGRWFRIVKVEATGPRGERWVQLLIEEGPAP